MTSRLFIICLMLFAGLCHAADSIEVQALFPGKALLLINGEARVLAAGQSFAGVKMISADARSAVLEINGEQKTYTPGSAISTRYTRQEQLREHIAADGHGMFYTYGSINGRMTRFLVDTGATTVAMSSLDAKKLGIQYRVDGEPARVTTASGVASAWRVRLRSVRLGQLEQKNVEAMVVEGRFPEQILLGMTFLDRFKVTKEASLMTLETKTSSALVE